MTENCINCDAVIDLEKDDHVTDESLFTYWCMTCAYKEDYEVTQAKLDAVELAEVKARMEVERLTETLQKIHTEFVALAMTTEMNQAQLLEQLELLQQTDVYRAREENKRLREALSYYANQQDFMDLADAHITQMVGTKLGSDKGETARKALEGLDEQG